MKYYDHLITQPWLILAIMLDNYYLRLPLADLSRAVQYSSKNAHDESLPTSIQTMSCKLLLNLVNCIRQSEQEGENVQNRV